MRASGAPAADDGHGRPSAYGDSRSLPIRFRSLSSAASATSGFPGGQVSAHAPCRGVQSPSRTRSRVAELPYAAEISLTNPGCFIFLVDQSASMSDPIGSGEMVQVGSAFTGALAGRDLVPLSEIANNPARL